MELVHVEIRAKSGVEGIAAAFEQPEVRDAALGVIEKIVAAATGLCAEAQAPKKGAADPAEESARANEAQAQLARARESGHAAAQARAEELGIAELAGHLKVVQQAYDEAYTAAWRTPTPDGPAKDE